MNFKSLFVLVFLIFGRKEKIEVVSWDSSSEDVNRLLFMTRCSLFLVKPMFPRILCLNFFLCIVPNWRYRLLPYLFDSEV